MTKIRSRQQVVDAAAKVFAEKGYDNARIEDIAKELGVLQGSLYYHVSSKAALLRLVTREQFTEVVVKLEKLVAGRESPRDKLGKAVRAQQRYVDRHRTSSPRWFTDAHDPRRTEIEADEDARLLARYRAAWKSILEEGVAAGDISSAIDPTVTVLTLLGMCISPAAWPPPGPGRSPTTMAALQLDIVWSGLARTEGATGPEQPGPA
ncbi:TetR family transcriptional regulator [Pseudonocardia sulfidoxydans NBRC 16205]|uniref:TetR family transcriptional regulator n=1 Tax=Pseudonocardia sulfidoxydans NBRC 16205 TaxID=1223511 RepID=A0A511DBS9_9PSEU|nr:TetR/AcrR family transcriptional regulator [Pseudonocardia sulfidoxydans]GEL22260.1 TetR family transcriptional regulator [Pseudonocardia sulfidoxydans NBRC 16205]